MKSLVLKIEHDKKTFNVKKLALRRFLVAPATFEPEALTMKTALAALTKTAKSVSNAAANKDRKRFLAYWEFGKKYHGFPLLNPFQQTERFPEKPENHYVPSIEDFWKVYGKADLKDQACCLRCCTPLIAGRKCCTSNEKTWTSSRGRSASAPARPETAAESASGSV